MSTQMMSKVMNMEAITTNEKMVMLALSNLYDNKTARCVAKLETLAKASGMSDKQVRSVLRQLENGSQIIRRVCGYNGCTEYLLLFAVDDNEFCLMRKGKERERQFVVVHKDFFKDVAKYDESGKPDLQDYPLELFWETEYVYDPVYE